MSFDGGYDGKRVRYLEQVHELVGGVDGTIWWRHRTFCSRQIRESFVPYSQDAPPAVGTLAWAPVVRGGEKTRGCRGRKPRLTWGRKHPACEGFQLAVFAPRGQGKGGGERGDFAYYIPDPEALLHILRQNANPNVVESKKKAT